MEKLFTQNVTLIVKIIDFKKGNISLLVVNLFLFCFQRDSEKQYCNAKYCVNYFIQFPQNDKEGLLLLSLPLYRMQIKAKMLSAGCHNSSRQWNLYSNTENKIAEL